MINEKLHLLLLLALNKGVIQDDKITLSSKLLNKSVTLGVSDIKCLCEWYVDSGFEEGIINQFNKVVYDWEKAYYPDESDEESALTVSNIYRRYLNKVQIIGEEFESDFFFKLYSPEKVVVTSGELRGEFGRTWTDYESQLRESDIIRDDIGIWACSENLLSKIIRGVGSRKHYGNSIMVLKMLTGEKYLNQNCQEYIGNCYKVVYKQALHSLEDYIKLKDYLSLISTVKCGYKPAIDFLDFVITRVNYNRDYYDVNNIDIGKIV